MISKTDKIISILEKVYNYIWDNRKFFYGILAGVILGTALK